MTPAYESATYGQSVRVGVTPAVALVNPKNAHNVGAAIRAASCYGVKQVWYSGNRVSLDPEAQQPGRRGKPRMPREERMRGYRKVDLYQHDYFFEVFDRDVVPVAIELRPGSEPLNDFQHPDRALYVFGPEDGSIPQVLLRHCHRFVVIPAAHCLNLAAAVYTVLYDRMVKRVATGLEQRPELEEDRGLPGPDDLFRSI